MYIASGIYLITAQFCYFVKTLFTKFLENISRSLPAAHYLFLSAE